MRVSIVESRANVQEISNGVVLTPSMERWNDFGRRALVDFYVLRESEVVFSGAAKMLDVVNPERSFADSLEEQIKSGEASLKHVEYVSVLPDLQSYREIIDTLGRREAGAVLRALRDAAFANMANSKPGWLGRAQRTIAMHEVLLRSSESHFAFHNLKGLFSSSGERLDLASDSLSIKFDAGGLSARRGIGISAREGCRSSRRGAGAPGLGNGHVSIPFSSGNLISAMLP